MANNAQIDSIISQLSARLGTSEDHIRSAMQSGSYDRLLSKMDARQTEKINAILSDEEKAKKFLSTPQAQAIMKKLMG